MTTKDLDAIRNAIARLQAQGIDARVQTLFGAEGAPSIVIVIPGVRLKDGKLEDIDDANLTAMDRNREILEKQARWDDVVSLQKSILKHEHSEKDKKREQHNLVGYEYEYGRHSIENNQLEKAEKAFKNILRAERDFVPATLGIAEVLLQKGESEEAVNVLEKAYENTNSKIVLARLEDLLISLGEPSRLIRLYRGGISRNPNDPVTRFFLGKLFYGLEMIDDAFDTLSDIDTGGASYPELHLLIGNGR